MNTKRFFHAVVVAATFAVLLTSTGAVALDEALQADFTALGAYAQGVSETPLRHIAAAVRAADADPAAVPSAAELETALVAVVEGGSTLDGKRFACRMLGEISGPAGAAALAGQLANAEIASAALTALEQMDIPEAANALIGALTSLPADQRPALLAALGRQSQPASATAIAPYLADGDDTVAYTASQALAKILTPESCGTVFDQFGGVNASKEPLFADACLTCAGAFLDSDARDKVLGLLTTLSGKAFAAHVRLAASSLMIKAQPEKAQEILTALLQDDDPAVSSGALMLARTIKTPAVTETLVAMLGSVAAERKTALIDTLGARGDASALPAIQALANDEVPEVRQAALRTIGLIGNASLTGLLLERAANGKGDELRIAREALAKMADPAVNGALLQVATGSADETLRLRAIAVLAERRAVETTGTLLELAGKGSAAVRTEAMGALRTLAPGEMLNQLLLFVTMPTLGEVASVLPQALADVAKRRVDAGDTAAPVADMLHQVTEARAGAELTPEQRTAARCVLLETLALIGTDTAFSETSTLLTDDNVDVRKAAINALGRFQRTEALAGLQSRVNEEQDAALRTLAYSAYLASLRNASALPRKEVDAHLEYAFQQAQTTAARREFLAAATKLPSLACLHLIEQLISSEDVAAEAARAALTVCPAISGAWPEAAKARLEAIAGQGQQELEHEAKAALNFMRRQKGYLMAWEVAGPYSEEQTTATVLFDRSLPPETDAENANWRLFPLLVDANPPNILELDRVLGGEERAAFLRCFITADAACDATLELGTNDGCKVWWNGSQIHAVNIGRPLTPGEDKLPVHLNAGVNTLMIAVYQQGGAWSAVARLTDAQGEPLEGISVSSVNPGK